MMRTVLALLVIFAIVNPAGSQSPASDVALDHIILGIDRLDRGIEEFARLTGVDPQRGGEHPGRGTGNALVGLGGGAYLEILAPVGPPRESGPSTWPARLTASGWALRAANIESITGRLRAGSFEVAGPMAGSRKRPDGSILEWQTAGVRGPGLELAPFFIQWSASTAHPSTTSPGGCRVVSFELIAPDATRLDQFFAAAGYQAIVRTGRERGMRLTLQCPKGKVSF
jgi:hypothetical protein